MYITESIEKILHSFVWFSLFSISLYYCAAQICIARTCYSNVAWCPSRASIVSRRLNLS